MFRRTLPGNAALGAVVLASVLLASPAHAADDPPNIVIKFETFETLPDGKENRLSAPSVITKPGLEATIGVSDSADYFEFKARPDWKDGRILFESVYEMGRIQPDKLPSLPHGNATPKTTRGPAPPRPDTAAGDSKATEKTAAEPSRPFPDNLHMKGFAKLPGKPPRIVLLDLNRDEEFWIHLGRTVRDIRFVSVDFSRSDPRALLEHKGQFAEVKISSPKIERIETPKRVADKQFTFTDLVKPGETLIFDIGLSKNGHPQQLRLTAQAQEGNSK